MWDYVFVLTCADDVASRGASDSHVKSKSSIVTYVRGYVVHTGSSVNHFKMI